MRSLTAAVSVAGLMLMAALLAGCSSKRNVGFEPLALMEDEAAVYIFRLPKALDGSEVKVFLDQEPLGTLSRGEHFALSVPPGEHFIRVEGGSSVVTRVVLYGGMSGFVYVDTRGMNVHPSAQVVSSIDGPQLVAKTSRVDGDV